MSINMTGPSATTDAAAESIAGSPPQVARPTSIPPKLKPKPVAAFLEVPTEPTKGGSTGTAIRGMARALVTNMTASLSIPTATSVRTIPAKLMIDNRIVINIHMARARGGKVSITHLIGWALVKALADFPSQIVSYAEVDGKPFTVTPDHVNLGIAVDVTKPDGSRFLVVPNIKRADEMSFGEFLSAYETLILKSRANALTVEDFAGTTLSLTNPGGIGTEHSITRLMEGQGCVIGAGALEYPAEFQGASEQTLADLAISKTITLTSTYDHRVIQGAASGEFLRRVHELLTGQSGFYEEIFDALRIPYEPIRWAPDIRVDPASAVDKTARVQQLIEAYRTRGHLIADIDPLEYAQRSHPDLDVASHGLTFWDLDREFITGDFGGDQRQMKLRDIVGVLRDAYCRTVGIEYMHIQDPEQRAWIQDRVELPYTKPTHDEQMRILGKLNEAEAFETFLQTKYIGQTRFSLEGGESTIPLLDAIMHAAANSGLDGVAIAMAHRGRLSVLTNIAGKTYGQVFHEFEGTDVSDNSDGSGDVKYHLGTEGIFTGADGERIPVYVGANPSHLDAVDGVLEGIVRARQDLGPAGTFRTLPIIIHGDAAMAGQGVVGETMQMSQLRGYRTGGTIRININNQVGFTTLPGEARSSVYSTDVAKAIQAPIFHVNGDDPEAVVRVAELAFAYRQRFHREVVIDLICYRRRGHNEADDPSMTQPQMYDRIEAKRSVRTLYTEALVGRGDITVDEYEQANADFRGRLESAFAETHAEQGGLVPDSSTHPVDVLERMLAHEPDARKSCNATAVSPDVIALVGDAFDRRPSGFTVHPKLQQLLDKRVEMSRGGDIDWAFAELLAFGSLLVEGTPVRLTGQDSRRGTFVQRHAVLHDRDNGREWLPLTDIAEEQGRIWIYDSLLSEYAVMGFEYGYSVERSDALVLWEAQFGDFANGAQIIIDEFISSADQKWGQQSSLVLLLPHGYEGSGPDHSSARIERFLQLCAENNMTVAQPSTPASYFHLLRRQAYARPRKPLIVFTPKSMLRMRGATSALSDFTGGTFEPVIDDQRAIDKTDVRRVLLASGKLYYELLNRLAKSPDPQIALVRIEQFYPLPEAELADAVNSYPNAELVWVQEEPRNQGAWTFLLSELGTIGSRRIRLVSRAASAAPATGSSKRHAEEQRKLIDEALEK